MAEGGISIVMNNREKVIKILNENWSVAKETGMDDESECCAELLMNKAWIIPDTVEPTHKTGDTSKTINNFSVNDVRWVEESNGSIVSEVSHFDGTVKSAHDLAACLLSAAELSNRTSEPTEEVVNAVSEELTKHWGDNPGNESLQCAQALAEKNLLVHDLEHPEGKLINSSLHTFFYGQDIVVYSGSLHIDFDVFTGNAEGAQQFAYALLSAVRFINRNEE